MELTSCPECGLVAEVVDRDVWPSTDGPVEHATVRCAAGHRFVLPLESLERHHRAAEPDHVDAAHRGAGTAGATRHVRPLSGPGGSGRGRAPAWS